MPAPAPAAVPAQPAASGPAATALPPAGPNTLDVVVSKTSWVEVYDDNNKRLLYGLLTPGTSQRLNGKPPYDVVLGHPQGVRLSMGGKPIDLSRYTSESGTARFEVERP
jgi:hypothetical protein